MTLAQPVVTRLPFNTVCAYRHMVTRHLSINLVASYMTHSRRHFLTRICVSCSKCHNVYGKWNKATTGRICTVIQFKTHLRNKSTMCSGCWFVFSRPNKLLGWMSFYGGQPLAAGLHSGNTVTLSMSRNSTFQASSTPDWNLKCQQSQQSVRFLYSLAQSPWMLCSNLSEWAHVQFIIMQRNLHCTTAVEWIHTGW